MRVAIKHDGGIANSELVGTKSNLNLHEIFLIVLFRSLIV
jgi:hypothetical protein